MGVEGLNQLLYIFKELKNNMTQNRGNKSNDSELKNITDGIEIRKMELDMVACSYWRVKQEDYRFERGQCGFIVRIYLKKLYIGIKQKLWTETTITNMKKNHQRTSISESTESERKSVILKIKQRRSSQTKVHQEKMVNKSKPIRDLCVTAK